MLYLKNKWFNLIILHLGNSSFIIHGNRLLLASYKMLYSSRFLGTRECAQAKKKKNKPKTQTRCDTCAYKSCKKNYVSTTFSNQTPWQIVLSPRSCSAIPPYKHRYTCSLALQWSPYHRDLGFFQCHLRI